MIESRAGKYSIMAVMVILSGLILVRATERKKPVPYALAGVLVVWAAIIGFRSKLREMPPAGSILGDVDDFLASVPVHAEKFTRWGSARGLAMPLEPEALEEWIWDHREIIGADWPTMLRPTVAAFGECLRLAHPKLAWAKRGGDAVLEVPGRPWTRRRLALEVHDNVFSDV
jgi:hypothetical protein